MALAPANNAGIPLPVPAQHPPTPVDITNARDYTERLVNSKRTLSNHAATDQEIGLAERHLHTLVMENTLTIAPLTTLGGILNHIVNSITRLEASLDRVDARLENSLIGRLNKDAMLRNGVTTFRSKLKQISGDGTILANTVLPHNFAPMVGLQAVPQVGAVLMANINTRALSHQDFLMFIQFYNESFDIQQGDTVATRTQKLANWLTATF